MSHRPKVPSTLKFLEGVEVSFLLSLKFFNFLFLYQESQVSRFPKRAPGSHEWARPSVLCRTHRRTAHVACGGPHVPMSLLQEQRTLGDHGLAGSHTTFEVAKQHLNRPTGSRLAPGHFTMLLPPHIAQRGQGLPTWPPAGRATWRGPHASPSRDRTRRPSRQARWHCGPLRCPGQHPD